jgi:hypothetical protein
VLIEIPWWREPALAELGRGTRHPIRWWFGILGRKDERGAPSKLCLGGVGAPKHSKVAEEALVFD